MEHSRATSLAAELEPTGAHPEWWPTAALRSITPTPTGWVRILERTGQPAASRGCALVPCQDVPAALDRTLSLVSEVGWVDIFTKSGFHDGLADPFDGRVEFFCQVRWEEPLAEPSVEWAWPFLWYWRATRQGDKWLYVDEAGHDIELARVHIGSMDDFYVEVQAMPLRHYLELRDMAMLISLGIDHDHRVDEPASREDHSLACDWAAMDFMIFDFEDHDTDASHVAATSLHGQYVILPAQNSPGPRRRGNKKEPSEYPHFVYAIDPASGQPLTVQPTRENAGYDGSPGPHFWTRIFFSPQVLQRYLAQPQRYRVSATRIECLPQWGLSIGRTPDGFVEVDLYDLASMPSQEWPHWKGHNVPPSGEGFDEGKFRRERLNQIAASPDVAHDLRRSVELASTLTQERLGRPLWRPLVEPAATEWAALHAPVLEDRSALLAPLLTLTKVLIDNMDPELLRGLLDETPAKEAKSLALLEQYVKQLGGTADAIKPFREIQAARSRGGFAHYGGSTGNEAYAAFAGSDRTPTEIFNRVCRELTSAVNAVASVIAKSAGE